MPKLQLLPVPPVFPLDDLAFRAPQRMPHYVAAEYAPEYEKYGGPVGVEIAERLFELSSERALEVALAGPELWPLRETLSLRMMWDLVRCFHPDEKSQAAFLQYYFWYWSGQDRREAFSLRTRFTEVARSRAADIPEKLAALGHHRLLKVVANEYRAGLATTARELDQADLPIPQTRLCFDYLHMNNNRLGIKPVEEAYLAALLL
jgi:thiopeptide-type bacteriocin biosynthesis protein